MKNLYIISFNKIASKNKGVYFIEYMFFIDKKHKSVYN